MTKSETLRELSEQLDITQTDAEQMYDALVGELTNILSGSKGFTLPGLGSFYSEIRDEHKSYNPHYKKMMLIPSKKVVHFNQSTVLRDEVNEGQDND